MTQIDEHGRPEPPPAADEVATLLGFLEYQRATFAWKCRGLYEALPDTQRAMIHICMIRLMLRRLAS